MSNWAIVIGIDKYWHKDACLKGAVKDALDMRAWLLNPNGGNVPDSNMTLLLEPDLLLPPLSLKWVKATSDNIVISIDRILERSGGQGERFYLHFSGHGLTARINASNRSGIVASDFTPILPDKTLTLLSLFELFQSTQFKEQFFFIDACRNMPFETEKRLRDYPNPREQVPPVSPQFVMYATMPGVKAVEVLKPGSEHGAFTGALLAGFIGSGVAKRWDEQSENYVVRWNSLFEYVEKDLRNRKLVVAKTPKGPVIQVPRQYGEHGTENPILGVFPESQFAKGEPLDVDLDPPSLGPITLVTITDLGGTVKEQKPPIPSLPLRFLLPPRRYGVMAVATGYVSPRRVTPVHLYGPEMVRIELVLSPPGPPGVQPPGEVPPEEVAALLGALSDPTGEAGGGARDHTPPSAAIDAHSSDRLAEIEISDEAGKILRRGRGQVWVPNVKPGFYRARLVMPEGDAVEQLIQVGRSGTEAVALQASPPKSSLVREIATALNFPKGEDNTLSPSEAVGPVAGLQLSTVLALAAAAEAESQADSPPGRRLRSLGVPAFPQTASDSAPPSGIQIMFGDESQDPAAWGEVTMHLWPAYTPELEEVLLPTTNVKWPQLASAVFVRPPGAYVLRVRLADRPTISLGIHILPGRLSLIVMTLRSGGSLDLYQYMLLLPQAAAVSYPHMPEFGGDPEFHDARFAAIRRIEWMQRCVAGGRIFPTKPDIELLLWDKWRDPIAGCLGGYLMIRLGEVGRLAEASGNLVKYFGELPDSHVLRGAFLDQRNPVDAAASYGAAMNCGLPIFRDGLGLLAAGAARHELKHPIFEQLKGRLARVPAGTLWNAVPDVTVYAEQPALIVIPAVKAKTEDRWPPPPQDAEA